MGNCQAIDAATLIIQHTVSGRVDKLCWPISAKEVMKMNPGYCVALLISTTTTTTAAATSAVPSTATSAANNPVRLTRIKLLRPTDTLALGHVYRLIPTQEVMKGLWEKKQAKLKMKKKEENESAEKPDDDASATNSELEDKTQVKKRERNRGRSSSTTAAAAAANSGANRSRTWQPSLQSILEVGS